MIVLFNSGYRELYRLNVLNTLHLPPDEENIYRYSSRPGYDYVDPVIKELARRDSLHELPCMVVFIDRSKPQDYSFIPLRRGHIRSISLQNQQYRLAVKLSEYINAPDAGAFTEAVLQLCGEDTPRPGPDGGRAVGHFVKELNDGERLNTLVVAEQASWAKTVDHLLALPCFSNNSGTSYVFTQLEHVGVHRQPPTWLEGSSYTISLSYRCDDDGSLAAKTRALDLMIPGLPIRLTPSRILLSGAYDTLHIAVRVPVLPSNDVAPLLIHRADESSIAVADRTTSICVKKRAWNLVLGSLYMLVFALSSAVLFLKALDPTELLSARGLLTVGCILLQVLSLAAIAFRMGRPIK